MLVTGCWCLMIFQTAVNWHWRALKNNWRGCSVRARRCSRYGDLEAPFAECAEKGEPVSCVLHFAALKAVGESVSHPLRYYDVNVTGTLNLLAAMHTAGIRQMVFSSSATVYRPASDLPIRNSTQSDRRILMAKPRRWWSRYCEIIVKPTLISPASPCGISIRLEPMAADKSEISPWGFPIIFSIHNSGCNRQLACVAGFGTDYPTVDGSGVRDYIHVSDLAAGHVKAVDWASENDVRGFHSFNLGTGRGTSVLQLIQTFEATNGVSVPFEVRGRRNGDIAEAWADVSAANRILKWSAMHSIEDMCRDGWNWQQKNPDGYVE